MNGVISILAMIASFAGTYLWLTKLFPDLEYKPRLGISGGISFIVFLLILQGLES